MGIVVWLTGLSGSGKSTIAVELKDVLEQQGKRIEIIDGDAVRNTLHKHFTFSREDIRENNRLIAELAKKSPADIVLVPVISPYREDRKMARTIIGKSFIEVFVNRPLEKCIERDVKGLYKKALSGVIQNFIGVAASNPYEPPLQPDIEVKTEEMTVEGCVEVISRGLVAHKLFK